MFGMFSNRPSTPWCFLTIAVFVCNTRAIDVSQQTTPEDGKGKSLADGEEYFEDIALNEASPPRQIFSNALLSDETLTTLANALLVHPFTTWNLKHRFNSPQALGIDESSLSNFVDYPRNERLVRKLYKVLEGEDIFLTVIGGSNAGGAGVQEDEGSAQWVFPRVLRDWWGKVITPVTGSVFHLNLVSIGGTASDFYQYCHQVYLENRLDLVILESSVNDLNVKPPKKVEFSLALEQLTRQLLSYVTQPALIYVMLYPGRTHDFGCKNLYDYGQKEVAEAYKITSIRWRDLVCPLTVENVRQALADMEVLCKDRSHVNLLGHAQVSLMLINTIRETILDIISKRKPLRILPAETLPTPVYIKTPEKMISHPLCWTTITPNYQNTSIKVDLSITVVQNIAFEYLQLHRMGYPCHPPRVCRADAYAGWVGRTVGATLIISFVVPPREPGAGFKTRSVVFATRTCDYCGNAKVWIDNDFENGKLVEAKRPMVQTSVNVIALHVKPGVHTLTIRVVEPANVTLAGLMLGPGDGPY